MRVVGLTGGIGSGKSTVSAILRHRGFEVIDADEVAKFILQPGKPCYDQVLDHFGTKVIDAQGNLDRSGLGEIIFHDATERQFLNSISHPLIRIEIAERLKRLTTLSSLRLVFVEIPLVVETGGPSAYGIDVLVVIDTDLDIATRRLVDSRGMTPEEVYARMGAQASSGDRLASADYVVHNNGSTRDLEQSVSALLSELGIADN